MAAILLKPMNGASPRFQAAVDAAIARDPRYYKKNTLEKLIEPEATPTKRTNKYNVAAWEDRTTDGIVFDSKKEMEVYLDLKLQEKAGIIHDLKLQPAYPVVNAFTDRYKKKHLPVYYYPDFEFYEGDQLVVLDAKGMKTDIYKLKKKLFLKRYPEIDFREV